MNRPTSWFQRLVRSPIIWGGLMTLGLYTAIQAGWFRGDLVARYFDSHPIARVAVFLFFVGLASLAIKGAGVLTQWSSIPDSLLGPIPPGGQTPANCAELLQRLASKPRKVRQHALTQRLVEALRLIQRKGNADGLDSDLHYLADAAAASSHASFGLVRIIIWAIPILGFLGTVVGITIAIARLSPEALEQSLDSVTSGLAVAFDTTALALALSMVLMFVQFMIDRTEGMLLLEVERKAEEDLIGRFQQFGSDNDPHVATVRRMAETMVEATQEMVRRQSELWESTVHSAHEHWSETATTAGEHLEQSLRNALGTTLSQHAQQLIESENTLSERSHQRWLQVQGSLENVADALRDQQAELAKQGEVLLKAIEAAGEIRSLEASLNANLSALANSQDFAETTVSLSAAVNLLSARLGHSPMRNIVNLSDSSSDEKAA